MISYQPLWDTMEKKGISFYALQKNNVSSSTIRRMKAKDSVSTNTIDNLCRILKCSINEVIEYIEDENSRPL